MIFGEELVVVFCAVVRSWDQLVVVLPACFPDVGTPVLSVDTSPREMSGIRSWDGSPWFFPQIVMYPINVRLLKVSPPKNNDGTLPPPSLISLLLPSQLVLRGTSRTYPNVFAAVFVRLFALAPSLFIPLQRLLILVPLTIERGQSKSSCSGMCVHDRGVIPLLLVPTRSCSCVGLVSHSSCVPVEPTRFACMRATLL